MRVALTRCFGMPGALHCCFCCFDLLQLPCWLSLCCLLPCCLLLCRLMFCCSMLIGLLIMQLVFCSKAMRPDGPVHCSLYAQCYQVSIEWQRRQLLQDQGLLALCRKPVHASLSGLNGVIAAVAALGSWDHQVKASRFENATLRFE